MRHGIYSRSGRVLAPRAAEIAEALLEAPHVRGLDVIGAEEIGSLVAIVEACDAELARSLVGRGNRDRLGLLKVRLQASRRLEEWAREYGLTPRSRGELAAVLATGETIVDGLRRRRETA